MSSAAKVINSGGDMTTPKGDEGGGAKESPHASGPSGQYEERSGPAQASGRGWKGGYSDTAWLGNPAVMADRQFASSGGTDYFDDVNITYPLNEIEADIYMVPNFQGQSGQGANQSTLRPIGSV
jgi:hypothetical protein